ncbi:MAG: hypothetical protein JXB29_05260 [Sedimentisphaerales bacterium]|nr:hypothetical protein [Sedimentisphaerales bacterium]
MLNLFKILAAIEYDGELSAGAYIILAVVLMGIIAGLAGCFYMAVRGGNNSTETQSPDEVGDEQSDKQIKG